MVKVPFSTFWSNFMNHSKVLSDFPMTILNRSSGISNRTVSGEESGMLDRNPSYLAKLSDRSLLMIMLTTGGFGKCSICAVSAKLSRKLGLVPPIKLSVEVRNKDWP